MKVKPTQSPARSSQPATRGEIDEAIKALTQEDTERIEQIALNRIYRIFRAANGRCHMDLIQEAFTRILGGARQWYRDRVGFTDLLIGAIYSIASEWAGHRKRNKGLPEYASLQSALSRTGEDGDIISPFDQIEGAGPNPIEELIDAETDAENKEIVEKIEAAFEHDEKASIVLMGFQDGMGGPTIRATFDISEKEYRTTVRRIQRGARKMMGEVYGR